MGEGEGSSGFRTRPESPAGWSGRRQHGEPVDVGRGGAGGPAWGVVSREVLTPPVGMPSAQRCHVKPWAGQSSLWVESGAPTRRGTGEEEEHVSWEEVGPGGLRAGCWLQPWGPFQPHPCFPSREAHTDYVSVRGTLHDASLSELAWLFTSVYCPYERWNQVVYPLTLCLQPSVSVSRMSFQREQPAVTAVPSVGRGLGNVWRKFCPHCWKGCTST